MDERGVKALHWGFTKTSKFEVLQEDRLPEYGKYAAKREKRVECKTRKVLPASVVDERVNTVCTNCVERAVYAATAPMQLLQRW